MEKPLYPITGQWPPYSDEISALVLSHKEDAPIVFQILSLLDGFSYRQAARVLSKTDDLLKHFALFNSEDSGLQHIRAEVQKCLQNKNQSPQPQDE